MQAPRTAKNWFSAMFPTPLLLCTSLLTLLSSPAPGTKEAPTAPTTEQEKGPQDGTGAAESAPASDPAASAEGGAADSGDAPESRSAEAEPTSPESSGAPAAKDAPDEATGAGDSGAEVTGAGDSQAPDDVDDPAPADAAEPAFVDPFAAEAAAVPSVESAPKKRADKNAASPLVPASEIEQFKDAPVDGAKIKYRPGKGLAVKSEDDRFSLTTGLRVQMLYTLNHDNAEGADPALTHSFQIRRARLVFKGHMFNEHNKFKTELSFSPKDIGLKSQEGTAKFTIMRDYYLEFDYLRDFTVRVGQYKLPYSQQRVISSGRLQMVDRSIAGKEFDFDRDIGLDFRSKDFLGLGKLKYYAGIYFGGGRDNYTLEPVGEGGGLVYLARIEVAPFGQFNDYVEGDFKRTNNPRLSLGATYSYMDDAVFNKGTKGTKPTDGSTTDIHNVNATVAFKMSGFSLMSEFFWRKGRRSPDAVYGIQAEVDENGDTFLPEVEGPRNGYGWFAQGGYMIPKVPVELTSRYSQVRAVGASSTITDRDEVGGGINWYIAQHPFKIQLDYFRIWEEDMGTGEDLIRIQTQLSF